MFLFLWGDRAVDEVIERFYVLFCQIGRLMRNRRVLEIQGLTMNHLRSTTTQLSLHSKFSSDVIEIAKEIFNEDWKSVLEALTKPVRTYYVRCNTHKITPEELKRRLEKKGLTIAPCRAVPEALGIPIDGPFHITVSDQLIVVDKQTAESVLQGANVYAPGIVNCNSVRPSDSVTVISELGEVLASGKAVMTANEILTFHKGLAVRVDHRKFDGPQIRDLSEFSEGLLYPQSLCAMAASLVLEPRPGETIVDMNCAPGGKFSHLSQLMNNSGRIFGFDRNAAKIVQSRRIATKLGCTNVILSVHDSRYLDLDFPDLKADRVLIDPPCSALGLRPKVYDFTIQKRTEDLAAYQKQFVKTASDVVKPGGTIVYSVCTFTSQECERVVEYAERECNLRVVEQKPLLGSKGLSTFGESASLCQRFHPHLHDAGYFIAKFER
jgi:16S rRNA (cytosine967-C5)-methyltransferase